MQYYNQWYVLFVATKSIRYIRKIVDKINKKYSYNVKLEQDKYDLLTRRWYMGFVIDFNYNDNDLYEINKNIYNEFKIDLINEGIYSNKGDD